MYSSTTFQFLHIFIWLVSLGPNSSAQSLLDDVTDPRDRAQHALSALQAWYNVGTGLWDTTGWWNSANIVTMVGNLAKAKPDNDAVRGLVEAIFVNTLWRAPAKNPQPGIEDPLADETARGSSTSFNASHATGYTKVLDAFTNQPQTIFPPNWVTSGQQQSNLNTVLGTSKNDSQTISSPTADPHDWLDGFYDDDLWWALAWINAYDLTSDPSYLDLAEGIFTAVSRSWPTHCLNGGIYWSWEENYVNAIANELFFSTAAHLAARMEYDNKKALYIDWANRTLAWFLETGMMNDDDTINDGLTDDCENNDLTAWSYNQGVILGGLVELDRASPDPAYLELAARIAHAALLELSDEDGVIHDECEPNCGADGAQFKGVFMRNLQALHEAAPEPAFANAIEKNAESIWMNDRHETADRLPVFSVDWAGPWVEPANASTHSSAMDALVAAIVV